MNQNVILTSQPKNGSFNELFTEQTFVIEFIKATVVVTVVLKVDTLVF